MDRNDIDTVEEILTHLATGTTGEVWVAREQGAGMLAQLVALKIIARDLAADAAFINLFLAETRKAAQLRHSNVVQIADLCFVEPRPQFITEMFFFLGVAKVHRAPMLRRPTDPTTAGQ